VEVTILSTKKSPKAKAAVNGAPVNSLARCHPRGDRVLIRRDTVKKQTEGGILLPDSSTTRRQTGVIVRVGPGRLLDSGARAPMDLKPNDRVLILGYSGADVTDPLREAVFVQDEEYLMLREEDILATIDE
jgi:chaperonin GroES